MTTVPLPSRLKVGDKIVQMKYAPHEILTVLRADGNSVMLGSDNGNRKYHEPLNVELFKSHDYELITEGTTPCSPATP